MSTLKMWLSRAMAAYVYRKNLRWINHPHQAQQKWLQYLIKTAQNTEFGRDHQFANIRTHADFVEQVPLREYEDIAGYIDQIIKGGVSVLWPGIPKYLAKTSGTTAGVKYIPISDESMPFHINAARDALMSYMHHSGKADFVLGKMIFLQGSPELADKNGIKTGRLSGIVAHYVPAYLQRNRMPSWSTNCIEDWEEKVEAIVTETLREDMRLISGIPAWVQMYFERLVARAGKPVGEIFPNLSLFVHGGVQYSPYKAKMEQLIGRRVPSIELYPASEGFFAYQDRPEADDLLLLVDAGIFYEFVPVEAYGQSLPPRLSLEQVEVGPNYVLVISTNAGLWAYVVGDTVRFTSTAPYRIQVTGRVKHYISAFGEHVIGQEVERALVKAMEAHPCRVTEFTVAPQVQPQQGLPYHEWLIEFESTPADLLGFARALDQAMCTQNIYYNDLIEGKVLQPAIVTVLAPGTFNAYMKSEGKLGGQNKVPRLSNNRKLAHGLTIGMIDVHGLD